MGSGSGAQKLVGDAAQGAVKGFMKSGNVYGAIAGAAVNVIGKNGAGSVAGGGLGGPDGGGGGSMLGGGLTDIMGQSGGNMFSMLNSDSEVVSQSSTTLGGAQNGGGLGLNAPVQPGESKKQGENSTLNSNTNPEEQLNDGDFSVEGEKKRKGLFDNLNAFTGLMSGTTSVPDAMGAVPGLTKLLGDGAMQKIQSFDVAGGFADAYKGFNSVRDTFFVDGQAPQDWKNTAQRMDEEKKKKDEKAENKFINNTENRQYVSAKLMEKAKSMNFKNSDEEIKYVNSNLESTLQSLAKAYAPYGITSAKTAYELKDEGKKYGLTPAETIIQKGGFEKFDLNQTNVVTVNEKYNKDATTVSEVIPNAREYYNNGYRDIERMMDARYIQDTLKTSVQMATKLENALKNAGKVNYNGADKAVQSKIDEINKYYEKRLKGGN